MFPVWLRLEPAMWNKCLFSYLMEAIPAYLHNVIFNYKGGYSILTRTISSILQLLGRILFSCLSVKTTFVTQVGHIKYQCCQFHFHFEQKIYLQKRVKMTFDEAPDTISSFWSCWAERRRWLRVEPQMSAPKEETDRRMKATTASPTAVQVEWRHFHTNLALKYWAVKKTVTRDTT